MNSLKQLMADNRNPYGVTVGQIVVVELDSYRNKADHLTVTKVGREYATCDQGRFHLTSLIYDQGSENYRRRVWLGEQDYDNHLKRHELWRRIKKLMDGRYNPPETASLEQLQGIWETLDDFVKGGE